MLTKSKWVIFVLLLALLMYLMYSISRACLFYATSSDVAGLNSGGGLIRQISELWSVLNVAGADLMRILQGVIWYVSSVVQWKVKTPLHHLLNMLKILVGRLQLLAILFLLKVRSLTVGAFLSPNVYRCFASVLVQICIFGYFRIVAASSLWFHRLGCLKCAVLT